MKIRVTETFLLTDTEVDCLVEKHNLEIEGSNRRDPIRKLFEDTIHELIENSTVGMEEKIKAEKDAELNKLSARIEKFAKSAGEDINEIVARLLAQASAEKVTAVHAEENAAEAVDENAEVGDTEAVDGSSDDEY